MAESAINRLIAAIPGASDAIKYIRNEAEAGAKQAIPEIRRQVKEEVTPLIIGAIGVSALSTFVGLTALIVAVKKPRGERSLSGIDEFSRGKKVRRRYKDCYLLTD